MSARTLLNAASLNGAAIVAALVWAVTGSFLIGLIAFAFCVGTAIVAENIRFSSNRRR